MISHVVLFRPRASLTESEQRDLLDALRLAVEGIPTIRGVRIGQRILLNRPGYETLMTQHFEYVAIIDFNSEADLRAYLDHPAHTALGQRLFQSAEAVLAYDFGSVDPSQLAGTPGRN